jgi:hypothetical protein
MEPSDHGLHTASDTPSPIPSTVSEHLCIDFVNSRFTDTRGADGSTTDLSSMSGGAGSLIGVLAPP